MSIPSMPDSVYKLLTLLGIVLFAYAEIIANSTYDNYEKDRINYFAEVKRVQYELESLSQDLKDIGKEVSTYSKKMSVENPLKISDTLYIFKETLTGSKNELLVTDSVKNMLRRYKQKEKEVGLKQSELKVKEYILDENKKNLEESQDETYQIHLVGATFFFLGVIIWGIEEGKNKKQNEKLSAEEKRSLEIPAYSLNCQSCGKHFNSIVKPGKEANGDSNYHFCSSCYNNGQFTDPNMSVDEMVKTTIEPYQKKGAKKLTLKVLTRRIKKLQRWSPTNYN